MQGHEMRWERCDKRVDRTILFVAVSCWLLLSGSVLSQEELRNRWMSVCMQDKRIGYAHVRVVSTDDKGQKRFITRTTQEFTLERGRSTVNFQVEQSVTEDRSGRVLAFEREIKQGPVTRSLKGTLRGDRWVIMSGGSASPVQQSVKPPDVLGPWAVERVTRARGFKPGTEYTLPVFMSESPTREVQAEIRIRGKEAKQVDEVKKWLHRVEVKLSSMVGMKVVEWVDDAGEVWLTETQMGPLRLELKRTNKRMALQPPEVAEVMLSTAITPRGRIDRPRDVSELHVTVVPPQSLDTEDYPDLPENPWQSVTHVDGGIDVRVRCPSVQSATSYELPCGESDMSRYLQETPWLEITDSNVQRMSREAVGDETDALAAARKIETYVADRIADKGLGTGFATAAETARQLAGDCTEHAVLAAALARAAGLPSRVVCGLAYGGPMAGDTRARFYFHMWAEVYVGQWLPIDPALGSFDATHITFVDSDLARPDAIMDISSAVLQLPKNVEITVDHVEHR